MKLANITISGNKTLGLFKENHIIDAHYLMEDAPTAVLDWIGMDDASKTDLYQKLNDADLEQMIQDGKALHALDDRVVYAPVIQQPQKIICVGLNYRTHILEMGRELPKYPVIFAKYANTLAAHKEVIPLPEVSDMVDYEAELVFVIGKKAKHVKREDAMAYIAGFTVGNDVSVRDYQKRTIQFLQGKTFDKSAPIGPALVTVSEVPNIAQERLSLRLNGHLMQDTPLSDLVFSVEALVEQISEVMTLEPGDIIFTGTPGGVGGARNPQVWIQHGDTVEVEISNVGVLRNIFKSAAKSHAHYSTVAHMKTSLGEDQAAYFNVLEKADESMLHKRPYQDSWTIAEVIAHMSEARGFFTEAAKMALAYPDKKVGRNKMSKIRLDYIASHGQDTRVALKEQLTASMEVVQEFLDTITDMELKKPIQHVLPKFGQMELGTFLDHFIIEHNHGHLKQVQSLLNRFLG